jgi:hypothetical protein
MNRMRAQLTKTDDNGNLTFKDEDAPGGILDLTDEITSGSKRVFLTEEQKTWRSLSNLPEKLSVSRCMMFILRVLERQTGSYPQD